MQQVTGVFLFLDRAVDSTTLTAPSTIASKQATPTENTMKKCKQFLDYAASQKNAILTYTKGDMVLAIHSDASYLFESKERSRAGGKGADNFPLLSKADKKFVQQVTI